MFAWKRVQTPTGGVLECHSFQQHLFTFYDIEQYGTEPWTDFIPFFIGIDAFGDIKVFTCQCTFQSAGCGIPYFPCWIGYPPRFYKFAPLGSSQFVFFYRSPAIPRTIECAITCDCDILRIACRDRRLATTGFQAFKWSIYNRIGFEIIGEKNQCITLCI